MFLYMLPMFVVAALLNPIFNHQGGTILAYLPGGNPLTLESILYGLAAALMLISVIVWFSCFNKVMTSDKLVYLFGRVIPAMSMIFSMSLRFVPSFKNQIKVISNAQKCIGRDVTGRNIAQNAKHGIRIMSIMVTWALENAIEKADSMKGRGYGLPGRTAFSIFRFDRRDLYALVYILTCIGIIVAGTVMRVYHFSYFPIINSMYTALATVAFAAYFALGAFPLIVNIKDDIVWKSIVSKT
jgi:energy-coupling factor transport system permease protein